MKQEVARARAAKEERQRELESRGGAEKRL
jgi:hypothetical protein